MAAFAPLRWVVRIRRRGRHEPEQDQIVRVRLARLGELTERPRHVDVRVVGQPGVQGNVAQRPLPRLQGRDQQPVARGEVVRHRRRGQARPPGDLGRGHVLIPAFQHDLQRRVADARAALRGAGVRSAAASGGGGHGRTLAEN